MKLVLTRRTLIVIILLVLWFPAGRPTAAALLPQDAHHEPDASQQ
jgi:hypothetical protein